MPKFQTRTIASQPTLGEKLSQRREEQAINIDQVSRDISVSAHYLQALEGGEFDQLPGEVYARSFLKAYAKYLGLDFERLLNEYTSEQTIFSKTNTSEQAVDIKKPVERILWSKLIVTPKIIRTSLIGLVMVVILFYLGIKINGIIAPPVLIVNSPQDNLVTEETVIEISGVAGQEAEVKINGQTVLTDESGNFIETFVLQEGANVIEITAEKKRSKQAKVYRKIMVVAEG